MKRILYKPFFIKLLNWEYWPFHLVYAPLYPYWLFLCLKARSFFFFNTSNPAIRNGGFLMESKKEIYDLIPFEYYPPTLFFTTTVSSLEIIDLLRQRNFKYPLVGKPDIGMKGMGVKKLENENDVISYASKSKVDFLIQEYVHYQNEVGIFYYRTPGEERGHISGIVRKEFLSVKGDGGSTVEQLLSKRKRGVLQIPALRINEKDKMRMILRRGEELIIVPYGNHVRGAKFVNDSHLIDDELIDTIDSICKKINGYYYGRMDVRFNSWEELKQGRNFSIIELNGAGSEPTHIYDPKQSVFYAWREIIRHWNILYKVSKRNYHPKKQPYMSLRSGLNMFRENSAYLKLLDS